MSRNARVRIGMMMALVLLVGLWASPSWGQVGLPGSGVAGDPYLIGTAGELDWAGQLMQQDPNFRDMHYRVTADIDLSGYSGDSLHLLGDPNAPENGGAGFSGVFDGDGYTISNFSYASSYEMACSLFPYVDGGMIQDVTLAGPDILTDHLASSLVGELEYGTVSGCSATDVHVVGSTAGGLVGMATGSTISNCSVIGGLVRSEDSDEFGAGGLVMEAEELCTISNCHVACDVTAENGVAGGVAGGVMLGWLSDCSYSGDVEGDWFSGGLAGVLFDVQTDRCTVSNSEVYTEGPGVGGLVGWATNGLGMLVDNPDGVDTPPIPPLVNPTISDCHVTADPCEMTEVYSDYDTAGGLIGWNMNVPVDNCSATRVYVGAEIFSGGLVGSLGPLNEMLGMLPLFEEATLDGADLTNCSVTESIIEGYEVVGGAAGFSWGSRIHNCTVSNSDIGGAYDLGGIAGMAMKGGFELLINEMPDGVELAQGTAIEEDGYLEDANIVDCTVENTMVGEMFGGMADGGVGGVVGVNINCPMAGCTSNTVAVAGEEAVGGLVGLFGPLYEGFFGDFDLEGEDWEMFPLEATIDDCWVIGAGTTVRGSDKIGGLIGHSQIGTVTDCLVNGATVEGVESLDRLAGEGVQRSSNGYDGESVGGLIGEAGIDGEELYFGYDIPEYLRPLFCTLIMECNVSGSVSGSEEVGGLVGKSRCSTAGTNTTNCTVNGHYQVGGLYGGIDPVDEGDLWVDSLSESTAMMTTVMTTAQDIDLPSHFDVTWNMFGMNTSSGTVSGCEEVGGLIGSMTNAWLMENSSSADVSGGYAVGGLVGYSVGSTMSQFRDTSIDAEEGPQQPAPAIYPDITGGYIESCHSTGTVTGEFCEGERPLGAGVVVREGEARGSSQPGEDIGGLVGYASNTTIAVSSARGDVTGGYNVGGLVGSIRMEDGGLYPIGPIVELVQDDPFISEDQLALHGCFATGDVSGVYNVGGLAGYVNSGAVHLCYANGDVTGSDDVGGLIGELENSGMDAFTGEPGVQVVRAEPLAGTEPLDTEIDYGTVHHCYASGVLTWVVEAEPTGGEVTMESSYGCVGGLVGRIENASISASFWDTDTSGVTNGLCEDYFEGPMDPNEMYGRTTAEMMTQATFTGNGWDFTSPVWRILDGLDYPRLWWQRAELSLSAIPEGYGTVTGAGTYPVATYAAAMASPTSEDYAFSRWEDGVVDPNRMIPIFMDDNAYVAVFADASPEMASLWVTASPSEGGRVYGQGTYAVGDTVTMTAYANDGWVFTEWSDGSTETYRRITIPSGGATYTASFTAEAAVLNVVATPNGGGSVTGGGTYEIGEEVEITAEAAAGWSFVGWDDGNTTAVRTVTVPAGGASYSAVFEKDEVVITVVTNPAEGGSGIGTGVYEVGSTQMIGVAVIEGWEFTGWSDGATGEMREIVVPNQDTTYTANLQQETVIDTGSLAVTITPSAAVDDGGQWRLAGESVWYDSGTILDNLPVGGYTVEFSDLADWYTPAPQSVQVLAGQTTQASGEYSLSLTVEVSGNGVVSQSSDDPDYGEVVTISANPDRGWTIAGWQGTDDDESTEKINTVTMDGIREVTVLFDEVPRFDMSVLVARLMPGLNRGIFVGLDFTLDETVFASSDTFVVRLSNSSDDSVFFETTITRADGRYIERSIGGVFVLYPSGDRPLIIFDFSRELYYIVLSNADMTGWTGGESYLEIDFDSVIGRTEPF